MDASCLSSRPIRPHPLYSTAVNHRDSSAKSSTSLSFSLQPHSEPGPESDNTNTNSSVRPSKSPSSNPLRRPHTAKKPASSSSKARAKVRQNPLKNLISPSHVPPPPIPSSSVSLSDKLWLSSKLAPPPPTPPQEIDDDDQRVQESENRVPEDSSSNSGSTGASVIDYRQKDKIFVGNLPSWIKKNEVAEFFRQFGPIKNVILIKGHNETERNAGFGFVVYGGPTAAKSAMKAVEFDGVEFHGRVLTVKLDDGRRVKSKAEERLRYVEGRDGTEFPSKWHEEREGSRNVLRKVLETEPENWQAVVSAFERIKKVLVVNILNCSVVPH